MVLSANISILSALFWMRSAEKKADLIAASLCADKNAGKEVFEDLRKKHVEQRNRSDLPWLDPVHPFFTTRVAYLS